MAAAASSESSAPPSDHGLFRWKRVDYHLSNTVAKDDHLLDLGLLFGGDCLSPLPPSLSRIDIGGTFGACKFMENIVWNFYDQEISLQYLTWKRIKWLYDVITRDHTPSGEKVIQILLNLSKLSAEEWYDQHRYTQQNASASYDLFLLQPTMIFLDEVARNESILPVDGKIAEAIKQFLRQRAIVLSFSDGLQKVGLPKDDSWILRAIDETSISFMEPPLAVAEIKFNGFTLCDGILLFTTEKNLRSLISDDSDVVRIKAQLLTVACHETTHYLARVAAGDFNFSSPGKVEPLLCDGEYPEKSLELGRYVEMRLCGGVQPNWLASRPKAAIDFLNKAKTSTVLPLVGQNENDEKYLVKRRTPSFSFPGDLQVVPTAMC